MIFPTVLYIDFCTIILTQSNAFFALLYRLQAENLFTTFKILFFLRQVHHYYNNKQNFLEETKLIYKQKVTSL